MTFFIWRLISRITETPLIITCEQFDDCVRCGERADPGGPGEGGHGAGGAGGRHHRAQGGWHTHREHIFFTINCSIAITITICNNNNNALLCMSRHSRAGCRPQLNHQIYNWRESCKVLKGRSRQRCTKQYFKGLGVKMHHNHGKTYENLIPAIYLEIKCNPPT